LPDKRSRTSTNLAATTCLASPPHPRRSIRAQARTCWGRPPLELCFSYVALCGGTSPPPSWVRRPSNLVKVGLGTISPTFSDSPRTKCRERAMTVAGTCENARAKPSISAPEFIRMRTRFSHCDTYVFLQVAARPTVAEGRI
jgi:hypothetical protein